MRVRVADDLSLPLSLLIFLLSHFNISLFLLSVFFPLSSLFLLVSHQFFSPVSFLSFSSIPSSYLSAAFLSLQFYFIFSTLSFSLSLSPHCPPSLIPFSFSLLYFLSYFSLLPFLSPSLYHFPFTSISFSTSLPLRSASLPFPLDSLSSLVLLPHFLPLLPIPLSPFPFYVL